jgi:hypothetical protein
MNLQLSCNSLANIPDDPHHNDFQFILDTKSYPCPWYLAHLICPKLKNVEKCDPTMDELYVNTPDPNNRFGSLISLGHSGHFSFEEDDRRFLLDLLKEFDNRELYSTILSTTTTSGNLADIVTGLCFSFPESLSTETDVEFVAEHFDEMTVALFSQIPFEVAQGILSHPKLTLSSEDSLYNLLVSRFDDDERFYELLDLIEFEYLGSDTISDFVKRAPDTFEHLSFSVWSKICLRLSLPVKVSRPNPRVRGAAESLAGTGGLDGIIASLTSRYGGNVHESGIVRVTASSSGGGSLSNIVDFSRAEGFSTKHEPFPWICYDFGDQIVRPTGGVIVFQEQMPNDLAQVVRLIVRVSTDGSNWNRIGSAKVVAPGELNCRFDAGGGEGRYVKLTLGRQGLFRSSERVVLSVSAWEIYGDVRSGSTGGGENQLQRREEGQGEPAAGLFGPRPAPTGFGVCSDGRPLPAELQGLGHFLSERDPVNEVSVYSASRLEALPFPRLKALGLDVPVPGDMMLSFQRHRIRVTHYAILFSHPDAVPGWIVSTSLDREDWTQVDARSGPFEEGSGVLTFALETPAECLWLRLEFRGRMGFGDGPGRRIGIAGFDVFGSILR